MQPVKESRFQEYKAKWSILTAWVPDVGGREANAVAGHLRMWPIQQCLGPPCQGRATSTQRIGTFWLTKPESRSL